MYKAIENIFNLYLQYKNTFSESQRTNTSDQTKLLLDYISQGFFYFCTLQTFGFQSQMKHPHHYYCSSTSFLSLLPLVHTHSISLLIMLPLFFIAAGVPPSPHQLCWLSLAMWWLCPPLPIPPLAPFRSSALYWGLCLELPGSQPCLGLMLFLRPLSTWLCLSLLTHWLHAPLSSLHSCCPELCLSVIVLIMSDKSNILSSFRHGDTVDTETFLFYHYFFIYSVFIIHHAFPNKLLSHHPHPNGQW